MKPNIDEKMSLPIHFQLKEQLKSMIERQFYASEDQMPSVRELAGFLRINRNTVQKAYNELEHEGYVVSRQGKGIFVGKHIQNKINQEQEEILQRTIKLLEQKDMNIEEFAFALLARHQIRKAEEGFRPVLLFIECTISQSKELAEDLAKETGYLVKPCLLSDFDELEQDIKSKSYDLIVTTFLHVEEVEEKIQKMSLMNPPKVIACLLESNLMAMKHLQRLPKGSKIGIACATWEGTRNIRKSILQSGLHHLELIEGAGEAPDTIPKLINDTSIVVCSSFVAPMIHKLPSNVPVVIDDQHINQQSIQFIIDLMGQHRA